MMTLKEFDKKVKHVAGRLGIPFNEILEWRFLDFKKACELLGV